MAHFDRRYVMKSVLSFAAGLLATVVMLATHAAARPQVPPGVKTAAPPYTTAQAARGEKLVKEHCATCHREDLKSGEGDIGLSDVGLLQYWGVTPLGVLARQIQTTMPVDDPNTLTLQQATDVVAFVLWKNYYPAGTRELPADLKALNRIQLQTAEEHLQLFVALAKK